MLGKVGVSEHLGSDTFFHVHVDGMEETMTVRKDGEFEIHHGDQIFLSPQMNHLHKFDSAGLRMA